MIWALVLAAGQSKRMGTPKMMLPWNGTTVLGRVLEVCRAAGLQNALVVSGAERAAVEAIAAAGQARTVHNADYAGNEMLGSLQVGLRALPAGARAVVMALGDQPQIEEAVVRQLVDAFTKLEARLVVPSYQMRRGHPWLIAREWWPELLEMRAPDTARDFLHRRSGDITYVDVDTPSVLADLDTPADYKAATGREIQ